MNPKAGSGILTDYALDAFIAPELSKLGRPDLPSLASLNREGATWLPDFLLNHFIRFAPEPRERQYRFAVVRRTAAAIAEYELGRAALHEYVQLPMRQLVSPYFHALRHLEAAVAGTYQALSLASTLVDPTKPLFEDRKSDFGRLERVYVHSRHAHQLFDSQQVARDLTMTVWLTTEGLKCVEAVLTYTELADMLSMLGRVARTMVDPVTALPQQSS